jgi:exopolysaccharide production protein ExoZ
LARLSIRDITYPVIAILLKMIWSIQYLRGIAALMVVYHHADFQLLKASGEAQLPLSSLGAAGVDIFFVISGFIMWVTTQNAAVTPTQFLYRRIVRIVPLYWAITLLVLTLTFVAPQLLSSTSFDPDHAIFSLLFIPAAHPVLSDHILPFFIQGWTLNYEMFFYLIFALAIWKAGQYRLAAIACVLTGLSIAGLLVRTENAQATFYTSTIMLEFVFGIIVGWLFLRIPAISPGVSAMLLIIGILGLIGTGLADIGYGSNGFDPTRALYWGLPSAAIVAGAALGRFETAGIGHRLLSALGNSSYSLYLGHLIALPAIVIIWRFLGFEFSGSEAAFLTALMLSLASVGGWLTYILVERPMTSALKHYVPIGKRYIRRLASVRS